MMHIKCYTNIHSTAVHLTFQQYKFLDNRGGGEGSTEQLSSLQTDIKSSWNVRIRIAMYKNLKIYCYNNKTIWLFTLCKKQKEEEKWAEQNLQFEIF